MMIKISPTLGGIWAYAHTQGKLTKIEIERDKQLRARSQRVKTSLNLLKEAPMLSFLTHTILCKDTQDKDKRHTKREKTQRG